MWYRHIHTHIHTYPTVEYDPDIKRQEILTFATTWMNPEDIMLSGISQTKTNIV